MVETTETNREGADQRRPDADMTASEVEVWFVREVLPLEAILMRYLRHNWRDRGDIEDLRQEIYVRVCEAAQACWESIAELTKLLFAEPSPAPVKYWLARTGLIDSAEVRLPMVEVGAELAARLDREIARRAQPLLRRA